MMREPETFRELLHLRFTGRDRHFPARDKLADRDAVRKMGFETAKVYQIYSRASEVRLSNLPDSFVIKPHNLASKRGVHVLHRITGDQGYWDAMSRSRLWTSQVRERLSRIEDLWKEYRAGREFKIIAEERVQGEYKPNGVPLDYKFYSFSGKIRLILQINRNAEVPQVAFYDGDFGEWDWKRYLTLGKSIEASDQVVPTQADQLLEVVSKLSRMLNTPFCSIDMYASTRGPLVGELTRTPGAPYFGMFTFSDAYDRELAAEWKLAARELGVPVELVGDDEKIPTKLKNRLPK